MEEINYPLHAGDQISDRVTGLMWEVEDVCRLTGDGRTLGRQVSLERKEDDKTYTKTIRELGGEPAQIGMPGDDTRPYWIYPKQGGTFPAPEIGVCGH